MSGSVVLDRRISPMPSSIPRLPVPTSSSDPNKNNIFVPATPRPTEHVPILLNNEDSDGKRENVRPAAVGKKRKVPLTLSPQGPCGTGTSQTIKPPSQCPKALPTADEAKPCYHDSTKGQDGTGTSSVITKFSTKYKGTKLLFSRPIRSHAAINRQTIALQRKTALMQLYVDAQAAMTELLVASGASPTTPIQPLQSTASSTSPNQLHPPPSPQSAAPPLPTKTPRSATALAGAKTAQSLASALPDFNEFEKLIADLEFFKIGSWPPVEVHGDSAHFISSSANAAKTISSTNEGKEGGPGEGVEGIEAERVKIRMIKLGRWKTKFARRQRARELRKVVPRGGWVPEGSFELDIPSVASEKLRTSLKRQKSLLWLAEELRTLVLNMDEAIQLVNMQAQIDSKAQAATQVGTSGESSNVGSTTSRSKKDFVSGSASPSRSPSTSRSFEPADSGSVHTPSTPVSIDDPSQSPSGSGKKKKGQKKKRSVMANQSNPHHVDNYRPGRIIQSPSNADPLEPWPHHASLLFPPSMRFLSARPPVKTRRPKQSPAEATLSSDPVTAASTSPNSTNVLAPGPIEYETVWKPRPPERPAEEDYICCFCDYALFFGTEKERKHAIWMRKQEIKKRDKIKARVKQFTSGRSMLKKGDDREEWSYDGSGSEHDDEFDDEDYEDPDHGRCTCGRQMESRSLTLVNEPKPPDKDPPPPE